MKYFFLFILGCFSFLIGQNILAQGLPQPATSIVLTPAIASPGQNIYAELQGDYSIITNNQIDWYLDGVLIDSGPARRFINFIAPAKDGVIEARLSGNQNARISEKVRVGLVDLIWEAETYTPPFYDGKALFGRQTNIRLTAIPFLYNSSGARIPSESLIYTWDTDGTVLGAQSGTGRSSIIISSGSLVRDMNYSVIVSTADSNRQGRASISLATSEPEIHIYEHDPALGILFNRDLTSGVQITKSDTVLEAMPFYISASSRLSPSITNTWSFDGVPEVSDQPSITLLYDSNETGSGEVGVRVRHRTNFMQEISTFIPVSFGSR